MTPTSQFELDFPHRRNLRKRFLTLALGIFLTATLPLFAGKGGTKGGGGGGDESGSTTVALAIELDALHTDGDGNSSGVSNGLQSDGLGPYVDGADHVEAFIGSNDAIYFDPFQGNRRKDTPIRSVVVTVDGNETVTSNAWLRIDENTVSSHVGKAVGDASTHTAIVTFQDANGETWQVRFGYDAGSSEVVVRRLPADVDGKAQWAFWTDGDHAGALYRYASKRNGGTQFAGLVQFPISGVLTGLE